jgi:2-keto-4-pentenoate hydratase/2-oxohepta-3-ene-1,7-dioic acid hydratase in catechol pathway
MRLCRFDTSRLGIVEGRHVRDVTAALEVLPAYRYPLPRGDMLVANLDAIAACARALLPQAPSIPLDRVTLLSPVANPGKIIAAPVNYRTHLDEVRGDARLHHHNPAHTLTIHEAGVFLKAASSLVGPGEGIVIRMPDRRTDHEVELAVVIGREASRVPRAEALRYVAGYAIGLDITIRGSEDRSLRKSADTYSVLGPWLVTADEIPDPGSLDLQLMVNGELRQQSNTRYLILGVAELVELASSFYTLHPGDLIFTGTPEGVSPIEPGDHIVATIERIGTMDVRVRTTVGEGVPAAAGAAGQRGRPSR